MKQPYLITSVLLVLSLGACSPEGKEAAKENKEAAVNNAEVAVGNSLNRTNHYANIARENIYKTSYQIQKWVATPPELPKGPREIEQSYCYRSFHDVLCYRSPMPGAENRLVAYQGTGAEAPPQAVTQLLPTHPYDSSQLPQNRVANARPVFIGLPPTVKDDKTPAPTPELPPEAIPAPQPNPVLVPQL
jgi:hypothetical protein